MTLFHDCQYKKEIVLTWASTFSIAFIEYLKIEQLWKHQRASDKEGQFLQIVWFWFWAGAVALKLTLNKKTLCYLD